LTNCRTNQRRVQDPTERVRASRDQPAPEGACTGVWPPAGPAAANCRTTQRRMEDPPRARAGQPPSTRPRGCVHGGVATRGPGRCKLSDHLAPRGGPPRARAGQPPSTRPRGCVHGGVATGGPDLGISGRGPRPNISGNLAWSAWTHRFGPPLWWSLACPCSSVRPAQIVSGLLYPVFV